MDFYRILYLNWKTEDITQRDNEVPKGKAFLIYLALKENEEDQGRALWDMLEVERA